jgi:hypothetical protein
MEWTNASRLEELQGLTSGQLHALKHARVVHAPPRRRNVRLEGSVPWEREGSFGSRPTGTMSRS